MSVKTQAAMKADSVAEAAAKCADPVLEVKYDGWRFVAEVHPGGEVKLWSRTGKPYHQVCPEPIIRELQQFPPGTILDGEIVDGTNNKNCVAVTNVFGKSKAKPTKVEQDRLQYLVFDCLHLDGHDATREPLRARRQLYEGYAPARELERVALTAQAPAEQEYHDLFIHMGFEGSMVKDLDAPYAEGKRGWGWFKIKDTVEIDVVVMSMDLDGKGQHEGKVGKFVVGQYECGGDGAPGRLIERARVNPYDNAMREAMTAAVLSGENEFLGRVCTIKHFGVLKDGLRHPVFVRWREDKPAHECLYDNG